VSEVVSTLSQYELVHEARPKPMNEYRTLHFRARASYDKEWRQAFLAVTKRARVPKMPGGIIVSVVQTCRRGTPLPDPLAEAPTVKAAIDGIVDAGVIPDDTGEWVRSIAFVPAIHSDRDRLILLIEEADK
jgi:crossover junction endodeoxyribonuclease RusA